MVMLLAMLIALEIGSPKLLFWLTVINCIVPSNCGTRCAVRHANPLW